MMSSSARLEGGSPAFLLIESCRSTTDHFSFAHAVPVGDIAEPVDASPHTIRVTGNRMVDSRASGIILEADNAMVADNVICNVSSAAISSGAPGFCNVGSLVRRNEILLRMLQTGCTYVSGQGRIGSHSRKVASAQISRSHVRALHYHYYVRALH